MTRNDPSGSDFIATDHPCPGLQRLRAGFFGHAYDPHRRETDAIGVTERGTQAFRYRGADCASTAGLTVVLHPDELHDGRAVAPEGFICRMLYIDAALIGAGLALADAVTASGFADQSHMTRHFKARFGLTPGRYARLLRQSSGAHRGTPGMPERTRQPIRYRLGLNQPAQSPTALRMAEMAEAIARETDGGFILEVHPESRLGPDPQMFADVQKGSLEFYLSGATLGGIAPSSALPMLPFAFKSSAAVFAALDGGLGNAIRGELQRAGLHAFRHALQNGFHHITTSNRPINTAADFDRLKIRTPGGGIATEFFQALRAEAGMVPFSGMYEALKVKRFDGQSDPLGVVQSLHLDEVQTYLSLTGHWWSGFTLLVNEAAWAALPADIKWVTERNVEAYAKRQRADIEQVNADGEAVLAARGMIVNRTDTASIRGRLGDFYARWKAKFAPATWRLLEAHADGLG